MTDIDVLLQNFARGYVNGLIIGFVILLLLILAWFVLDIKRAHLQRIEKEEATARGLEWALQEKKVKE